MKSESGSDDGIMANEIQSLALEEMFVKFFCEESTFSEQSTQRDNKLKPAIESVDVVQPCRQRYAQGKLCITVKPAKVGSKISTQKLSTHKGYGVQDADKFLDPGTTGPT